MKKRLLSLLLAVVMLSLSSCVSLASRFEKVPAPQVTYAEFPFEIVYKLGNETVTINDVYICEFDGFAWNENNGKQRQWKGYVRGSEENYVVLHEDGNFKIACNIGTAAYYMSDPSMADAEEITPTLFYVRTYASGGVSSGYDVESYLEQYKIELISWQLSSPIENTFI